MPIITFIAAALTAPLQANAFCDLPQNYLETITDLRLAGDVDDAHEAATGILECTLEPTERVDLLVELAKIEDRIGLHQNTRPVTAAREALDQAEAYAVRIGGASLAAVTLARADYHYRAEMSERKFSLAEAATKDAITMFEALGDKHGQADAVHRLGLIHFQRRANDPETELATASELYDQSLVLDKEGGARKLFCGEYGRHVGYIYYVRNEYEEAIPHFENSLSCRVEAGAIDAAMFAAQTLGSTLVQADRAEEALAPLLYGLLVSSRINSPVGKARISVTLGDMYVELDQPGKARMAYQVGLKAAEQVNYSGYANAAREALSRLDDEAEAETPTP
ncbi:MAG: hypothetical protein DHS20C05_12130 [Hyphococcus sp.]|nr:MAG: hypothetical protein DHS20C05_12130 [Marinicaulis sp.]